MGGCTLGINGLQAFYRAGPRFDTTICLGLLLFVSFGLGFQSLARRRPFIDSLFSSSSSSQAMDSEQKSFVQGHQAPSSLLLPSWTTQVVFTRSDFSFLCPKVFINSLCMVLISILILYVIVCYLKCMKSV